MIFQNPMSALDPLCPVFAQLIEVAMIRQNVSKKEAVCRANELIERLGLPKELSKKDRLPSELSERFLGSSPIRLFNEVSFLNLILQLGQASLLALTAKKDDRQEVGHLFQSLLNFLLIQSVLLLLNLMLWISLFQLNQSAFP